MIKNEDMWLVSAGPDGAHATIVRGRKYLARAVVGSVFTDPDDTSDEANEMRDHLDDPLLWDAVDGDEFWATGWSFEDGYVRVQRITAAALATHPVTVARDDVSAGLQIWIDALRGMASNGEGLSLTDGQVKALLRNMEAALYRASPIQSEVDDLKQRIWDAVERRIDDAPTDGLSAGGEFSDRISWGQGSFVSGLRVARNAILAALSLAGRTK